MITVDVCNCHLNQLREVDQVVEGLSNRAVNLGLTSYGFA